jgi:hypothetical protein
MTYFSRGVSMGGIVPSLWLAFACPDHRAGDSFQTIRKNDLSGPAFDGLRKSIDGRKIAEWDSVLRFSFLPW